MNLKIFLFLLFISGTINAQSIHRFTSGYFLPSGIKYGRTAIVEDELAYKLFSGDLSYPKEGNLNFSSADENLRWTEIQTDSSGDFKEGLTAEGYLYLSYESEKSQIALLNISGHSMAFVNEMPRGGDIYKYGWLYSPVKLHKGKNDILIRCSRWARWQGVNAKLIFPENSISIQTTDTTLPHIILGEDNKALLGAIVVLNATERELNNLALTSILNGNETTVALPSIPKLTSRKVPFNFNSEGISEKGKHICKLILKNGNKTVQEVDIEIEAVSLQDHYSKTFISDIDGSVQYYSVTPQSGSEQKSPALFLSVHGAGVEAIGQARAYDSKDWGVLVAATNRRPRGFNWEDWGRIDALEVFELAKEKFKPNPEKIYLTGHSMGGHGTWYLGATYPGKWAAIGPCAGYPTLTAYGSSDGKIPEETLDKKEKLLLQASNPSNVLELAHNYNAGGVYIHHGDSDKVVSVEYARQMKKLLADFHKDFSYYEYPGGSHWFGDESVDWPPMFDYFKWHTIPTDSMVDLVDFTTASPAISSRYFWVEVLQQEHSMQYSKVKLKRDKATNRIVGSTSNIRNLSFELYSFSTGDEISIQLDDQPALVYQVKSVDDKIYLEKSDQWIFGVKPDLAEKGVLRGGTFKEPFNHKMVFVYSTAGSKEENQWALNKAIYDAEVWYYRGNGAVDIVSDKNFDPTKYTDRGVVIYGNSKTNKAWKPLLADCPIQVDNGVVTIGNQKYSGSDLGAYFMWPKKDSKISSIAVVAGTGILGMKSTEANQYFAAGSGFPDYLIFSAEMLNKGVEGIKCAGFYSNDWKLDIENSAF